MLSILFTVLAVLIFGNIFMFAIKAAWGISKIIGAVVLLPLFLVFLVIQGLIYIAFPILVIVGIVS